MRRALGPDAAAVVLAHQLKQAQAVGHKESDKSPGLRTFSGGAASSGLAEDLPRNQSRRRLGQARRSQLPASIYANLVGADDGDSLVWARKRMNS